MPTVSTRSYQYDEYPIKKFAETRNPVKIVIIIISFLNNICLLPYLYSELCD